MALSGVRNSWLTEVKIRLRDWIESFNWRRRTFVHPIRNPAVLLIIRGITNDFGSIFSRTILNWINTGTAKKQSVSNHPFKKVFNSRLSKLCLFIHTIVTTTARDASYNKMRTEIVLPIEVKSLIRRKSCQFDSPDMKAITVGKLCFWYLTALKTTPSIDEPSSLRKSQLSWF